MIYDVIVVGAGPAGATAAYETAQAGLTTLLLEKFEFPRDKPCGGAVMYRGIKIVREKIPDNIIQQKIHGLRFVLPNNKEAEFISNKLIGITVFRSQFDEFLAKRAETAGAELHENARVVNASVNGGDAEVRLEDGKEYKSKFLIGADGVNSVVSRSVGLREPGKNPYRIGLGMEADFHVGSEGVIKAMRGNPEVLEILPVDGRVSYGWVFPKKEHLAIGVAGAGAHMHPLRPAFDGFCNKMKTRLGVELNLEKRRTYFFGGEGVRGNNYTSRTLLVGDSAGFVDPLMGEGIAYAMRSGQHAAEVICKCILNNRYQEKYLEEYQKLCCKEFGNDFAMAEWAGLKGTSFAEMVLMRAQELDLSSEILAGLARGDIGYSQLVPYILRKLPREIPKLIQQAVYHRVNRHRAPAN